MHELASLFMAPVDITLGSIFTQLHAARIILAVQEGYIHAVERETSPGTKQHFLELTDAGRRWCEENQARSKEARQYSGSGTTTSRGRQVQSVTGFDDRSGQDEGTHREGFGERGQNVFASRSLHSDGSEYIKFSELRIGDQFKLVMGTGTPYKPVFRKLSDAEEDNAEIVNVKGRQRLCQFTADSTVLLVLAASS
jgi:hypothetical protein